MRDPTVLNVFNHPYQCKGTVRINQGGGGGGAVTLKKPGFRNMMTPINVSSFFYDPLKLEDQKAVTLP